ncbi:uncharacterized protein LOC115927672 [Strongylocentrotus purpuratus]|uniref:Myb/SANT-like DNA-binding domain-containing protein n=1 Tax=Strongylocentrotus purpuratus TaxID=7668 RepID=A0A7M7PCJ2_STRPU|nr:uncharacterized protein LOC115927672 [Strongylocentrotus purpuratus]
MASTEKGGKGPKSGGKSRAGNFEDWETLMMINFIRDNWKKLFSRAGHSGTRVEVRKKKYWRRAAEALRAAGGPKREWSDLKKKWARLKHQTQNYLRMRGGTGGGPCNVNHIYEQVITVLAKEVVVGILPQSSEAGGGGGSPIVTVTVFPK